MKSNEFARGMCRYEGCKGHLSASNSTGFCGPHAAVAGPPCGICGKRTGIHNRSGCCARCTWKGKR